MHPRCDVLKILISFPAVRACIFDLDGLLINSEDIITYSVNRLLTKYGRPAITRNIRVQLMGVPDSTSSDLFHDWAKLPIPREQLDHEFREEMNQQFTNCAHLPGGENLLSILSLARSSSGNYTELALASSTITNTFQLKSSKLDVKNLLSCFVADRRILGDDPRVRKGKPAPDIYFVALQSLRATANAGPGSKVIQPDECLVFEDSLAGVEAGRRAGMRAVWVPHPDVAAEWKVGQQEVLAGKTGTSKLGHEWLLRDIDDGWVEKISSLQHFDYEKYEIDVPT